MKKKWLSMLLAVALVFSLLPGTVFAAEAAEPDLPDWYFLFAIFKSVDADVNDGNGTTTHSKYTMAQKEVDLISENAKKFETYMNNLGVMRAHVDVVEIDTPVTELVLSTASDRESGTRGRVSARQKQPLFWRQPGSIWTTMTMCSAI